MLIYSFITDYQAFNLRYKDNTTRDKNETKVDKQSANLGKNNEPIQNRLSFLIDCKSVILHHLAILSFPMVRPAWDNWWLLVVSAFLHFPPFATLCKPTTCEILFRETNPKRDKNGTKSQENKIKNASSPTSLVVDFSFLCKGTILSREKQAKSSKYAAYQTFILHVHFQEDTASASCTDLCCLLQRPVKIRFMPFVHYGIAADAHCLGTVYNPSAIICNAEICVPSANW